MNKEKVGIAFGGGGARGYAHVGVLRALRNNGRVLPTICAGTSIGSVMAACLAADIPQKLIEQRAADLDWVSDIIDLGDSTRHAFKFFREGGLLSNMKLEETLNTLLEGRGFSDLPHDLSIVATDLEKRTRVIFTSPRTAEKIDRIPLEDFLPLPTDELPGYYTEIVSDVESIGLAARASCAVPGVFHPVEVGKYRLVDGGVIDQVPVDVVKAMGAGKIVAVSLGASLAPDQFRSVVTALNMSMDAMATQQLRKSLSLADRAFQISAIEKYSFIRLKQMDLADVGELDMNRCIDQTEWLRLRL